MHNFIVPLEFLHHDIEKTQGGSLYVNVPKFNREFHHHYEVVPRSIFENQNNNPQDYLKFSLQVGRVPYYIDFQFKTDDEHLACRLFHPTVDVDFSGTDDIITNASVRTISLTHNNNEISQEIPNLAPEYNYRSWVNPFMRNNDMLRFRVYIDLAYDLVRKKDLNML